MTKAEVFKKIQEKYGPEDLDDHVHEFKSGKASDINNYGMESQLEYLHESAGLNWLEKVFLK